jgi:predicted dinucleotide-binding enzyme
MTVSMRIGILGTGVVGQTLGSKLVKLGHEVKMGSRTASNPTAEKWAEGAGKKASHGRFEDAAAFGEILFNCTAGAFSLDALKQAGARNLGSKTLIDVANVLDYSKGMPPTLTVCNTDSLGEQIQRSFPKAKVVKALNTMNCKVMVDPGLLHAETDIFICGNDAEAKGLVASILRDVGWKSVTDLGDITGARGMEMLMPFWLRLRMKLGHGSFNYKIIS